MNNLITAVTAASQRAEYDAAVKAILAEKQVLAWILKWTAEEFNNLSVEEILRYIETPSVSDIPVNPGQTNSENGFITGLPQECSIINEGVCYYDIKFFASIPCTESIDSNRLIIVDVEAQKDYHPGYDVVTRGLFYCGRMLSEQSGRNFKNSDYDSLNKVYSIWLCFNCTPDLANTTSRYRMAHETLYGDFYEKVRYDILQVIIIRLPSRNNNDKALNKPSQLHEMLYDLFVSSIPTDEKIILLRDKYGLILQNDEGRLSAMCNLSEGIYEEGFKQGMEQGVERGVEKGTAFIINNMLNNGISPKKINEFSGIPLETILNIQATTIVPQNK